MSLFSRTLVIIKPDAVFRKLAGRIIQRMEDKGLRIVEMRMQQLTVSEADELYKEHKDKPWYKDQINFMTSGKCILMSVASMSQDAEVYDIMRNMIGDYGSLGKPGTIRGDFGLSVRQNLIHCSDSNDAAIREVDLFFPEAEL